MNPKFVSRFALMEFKGIRDANWTINVIMKWGDDFRGFPQSFLNGEKWAQLLFEDIDRDGDYDVVANCEEYKTMGFVFLAVLWFKNPYI